MSGYTKGSIYRAEVPANKLFVHYSGFKPMTVHELLDNPGGFIGTEVQIDGYFVYTGWVLYIPKQKRNEDPFLYLDRLDREKRWVYQAYLIDFDELLQFAQRTIDSDTAVHSIDEMFGIVDSELKKFLIPILKYSMCSALGSGVSDVS